MKIFGFELDGVNLAAVVALLIVLYMVFKIVWHPDFGLIVRRRILCIRLEIERDQTARVPFWWSNRRVQRALNKHWSMELHQGRG